MEGNRVHAALAAAKAAAASAPGIQFNWDIFHPRHLENIVLHLHLHINRIMSFLPNTSVGFLALAIIRSAASNEYVADAQREAVNNLMTYGGAGFWADLRLLSLDKIIDVDVRDLLSLVNRFGGTSLRRLTIVGCPGVDGSGLSPLIYSTNLEYLRFHDNKSIFLRRSRRLTKGPSPLEVLQTTFSHLINGGNLLDYVHVPSEWGGDGPLEEHDRILTCSEGLCCGRGPLQKLHWCQECRFGPFCEKGVGIFFVYCENEGHAYCTNCLRHSDGGLARKCPHAYCYHWYCSCLCDGGFCFECNRDVCYACGTFHRYDFCPHCDDCEYYHGLDRCN